jgi:hypothetical protein
MRCCANAARFAPAPSGPDTVDDQWRPRPLNSDDANVEVAEHRPLWLALDAVAADVAVPGRAAASPIRQVSGDSTIAHGAANPLTVPDAHDPQSTTQFEPAQWARR